MLIRLLSINIWDLPIPLPGFARRRRRRNLLAQLSGCDAELLLFQEAFLPSFKMKLARALREYRPDHYLSHRRRHGLLRMDGSGGLTTFSRLGVIASRYIPFRFWKGMKRDERIGRKGALWTQVSTSVGSLLIGNVHLYAGCSPAHARARAMQTRHLLRQLDTLPRLPTVIAGDFNMTIEYERTNDGPTGFDLMKEAGFTEIAAGETGQIATMSRENNRFARYTPLRKPERRLTQVFYRGEGIRLAGSPTICLNDPPVSDHFGLSTTLELAPD